VVSCNTARNVVLLRSISATLILHENSSQVIGVDYSHLSFIRFSRDMYFALLGSVEELSEVDACLRPTLRLPRVKRPLPLVLVCTKRRRHEWLIVNESVGFEVAN
jgi:hypothetical protein